MGTGHLNGAVFAGIRRSTTFRTRNSQVGRVYTCARFVNAVSRTDAHNLERMHTLRPVLMRTLGVHMYSCRIEPSTFEFATSRTHVYSYVCMHI